MKAFYKLICMFVIFAVGYISGRLCISHRPEKANEDIEQDYGKGPSPPPKNLESSINPTRRISDTKVFITEQGSKYHREDCPRLANSKLATSLESVKEKYAPCITCHPFPIAKTTMKLPQ